MRVRESAYMYEGISEKRRAELNAIVGALYDSEMFETESPAMHSEPGLSMAKKLGYKVSMYSSLDKAALDKAMAEDKYGFVMKSQTGKDNIFMPERENELISASAKELAVELKSNEMQYHRSESEISSGCEYEIFVNDLLPISRNRLVFLENILSICLGYFDSEEPITDVQKEELLFMASQAIHWRRFGF